MSHFNVLIRFCILTLSTDLSSDEEHAGNIYSNRGNKLKRGANEIYEGKLGAVSLDRYKPETINHVGQKRAIVYKKRRTEDNSDSDVDDIYKDINIGSLLAPINHPSEIPSHPAISRAFNNTTIKTMARQALEIITEEQKHAVQFARLMSVFLGDDPKYRKVDMLKLPELEEKEPVEEADALSKDLDVFFEVPQITVDRDYGIRAEDAEETRQLTQIAQQRSEEFIRCMTKVRFGLLKAERYQRQVWNWCKEMAGDEDDSDGTA